jgi:septal ring factor EnvC (AmiA/AmiB activator)
MLFFIACQKDKFCASAGGSYFSCAAEYKQVDEAAQLASELKIAQEKAAAAEKAKQDAELAKAAAEKAKQEAQAKNENDDDGISTTAIVVGFIVAGVFILALILCGSILILKEKAGKPLFGRLLNSPEPTGGQTIGSGQL